MTSNGLPVSQTSPVTRNSNVTVTCAWNEGYPPQTALLKKDGTELNSIALDSPHGKTECASLRQIDYVIQHVQCNETGLITCEATGSENNKNHTLLVKCE